MKNLYEVGRVYVWQNQRAPYERLNGMETTVTSGIVVKTLHGEQHCGQKTDTIGQRTGKPILAEMGDLRPLNPPPGEQSVLELFNQPKLATA
ncbi:hypothetical protein [Janthinobacterium sp. PSPC3-1]|uniref:hypothetical protein n=1 Tax=Janthinobacterium sp. PSPC3-1 TaxID=2804653 RepID=UPI003CEA7C79